MQFEIVVSRDVFQVLLHILYWIREDEHDLLFMKHHLTEQVSLETKRFWCIPDDLGSENEGKARKYPPRVGWKHPWMMCYFSYTCSATLTRNVHSHKGRNYAAQRSTDLPEIMKASGRFRYSLGVLRFTHFTGRFLPRIRMSANSQLNLPCS